MGGRKRIYDNLDALARKESVKRWLDGLTEGDSRRHALYSLNRYVLWREARDLEPDPDRWVEACIDGVNRTLIAHLAVIMDYVRGDVFEGNKNETRRKDYFRLRGLHPCVLCLLLVFQMDGFRLFRHVFSVQRSI
jgi:hypothetical protein